MDLLPRKIIHVDMDAFYASVEQRDCPELRGKPVIVGGSPEGRGVVASASYEARRFGVRSAMSSRRAVSLCPNAIFVRANFSKYKEVSRRLREIFLDVTSVVEPLGLDEAYLDVTSNKLRQPSATRLAILIRARIRRELQLTASAGVGPNKFIAKLASDLKKPDGLVVIPPEKVEEVVARLPVEKLWGVGPATAKKLKEKGLHTAEDLRRCSLPILTHALGRFGTFLHGLAHGRDERPVSTNREPKNRGSETTLERDTVDMRNLNEILRELADDVAQATARLSRSGKTVVLKVKYSDFTLITRSLTLAADVQNAEQIREVATRLLASTEAGRRPIRLLGISITNLAVGSDSPQLQLDF